MTKRSSLYHLKTGPICPVFKWSKTRQNSRHFVLTIRKPDQSFLTTSLDHFVKNNLLIMTLLLIKQSRLVVKSGFWQQSCLSHWKTRQMGPDNKIPLSWTFLLWNKYFLWLFSLSNSLVLPFKNQTDGSDFQTVIWKPDHSESGQISPDF
jgi:hypothetical protein